MHVPATQHAGLSCHGGIEYCKLQILPPRQYCRGLTANRLHRCWLCGHSPSPSPDCRPA
jgi:hypothetical protein